MSGLDQFKYRLGSVSIGLNQLISVGIGYYWLRSVNIGLDGLNIKEYWLKLVRNWLRVTDINRYLDRIILTDYQLILTNCCLRITKTEYLSSMR